MKHKINTETYKLYFQFFKNQVWIEKIIDNRVIAWRHFITDNKIDWSKNTANITIYNLFTTDNEKHTIETYFKNRAFI